MNGFKFYYLLCAFCALSVCCSCHIFSFPQKMKTLLTEELQFLKSLESIRFGEKNKNNFLSSTLDSLKNASKENNDQYLSHPINQFILLKQLAMERNVIENLAKTNNNSALSNHDFSKTFDMKSFTEELITLQNFYDLNTQQMALGIIQDFSSLYNLSIEDRYYIGKIACKSRKYHLCYTWMESVLSRHTNQSSINILDVMDHAINSLEKMKLYEKAFDLCKKKFLMQPFDMTLLKDIQSYRLLMNREKKASEGKILTHEQSFSPSENTYKKLCRNPQFLYTNKKSKNLKCFYWTNYKHPQLVIRPAKLEVISKSPWLARFYDVISDSDIEEIKDLARPKLGASGVLRNGKKEILRNRISQNAWLDYRNHTAVAKISRRITYITGLLLETSELLQVANYGMGGLYTPHWDYLRSANANSSLVGGDRIATALIYLNNVQFGGNTVFPKLSAAVKAIKGSAVFWYNLLPSGEGDLNTLHAACPVVVGEKWVANMWFREEGQLIQKCPSKS